MTPYECIDHTADLAIVVRADSLKQLFEESGRALFDLLIRTQGARPSHSITCTVDGADNEDLMVNWLRELLYLFNGEEKAVSSIEILHLTHTRVEARLKWIPVEFGRDEVLTEIKAVTYHQIRVEKTDLGYEARVVFDV